MNSILSITKKCSNKDFSLAKKVLDDIDYKSNNYKVSIIKNDNHMPVSFTYTNFLFTVEMDNRSILFSTVWVFPSMILSGLNNFSRTRYLHKDEYPGITFLENFKTFGRHLPIYEREEYNTTGGVIIKFEIENSIPEEVLTVCKLALHSKFKNFKSENVKDILIERCERKDISRSKEKIIDLCKKLTNESCTVSGKFTIKDSQWSNSDVGTCERSEYSQKLLKKINSKLSNVLDKELNTSSNHIREASIMEGGLKLDALNDLFNYNFILKHSVFRQLRYRNNSEREKTLFPQYRTSKFQEYTLCEVPLISALIFGDLLNSEGISTSFGMKITYKNSLYSYDNPDVFSLSKLFHLNKTFW